MSLRARAYVGSVLGASVALSVLALLRFAPTLALCETFAALTVLASVAQLFKAEAPNHVLLYASPIFFFAGVLLLPPFLFVLLVAVPHMVEWGVERLRHSPHLRAWYLQPFNIAMNWISGLSAYWLYAQVSGENTASVLSTTVLAGLAAVACFVVLNHILLGLALALARGVSWRESGMFELWSLLTDLVLACMGLVVAELWRIHPAFVVPALAPLVLMYQSLMIPRLKQQAEIDAKTGLFNSGHFKTMFGAELARATRFDRPLTVIMADLDLLRNVNNQYGHLAGDVVLAGIGKIIRQTMREYDISGRFGGEEFVLVAPEAGLTTGESLAERLRQAVADARFPIGADAAPIGVTMSLGVACHPLDGNTAETLIYAADMAVLEAKTRGRNCVVRAADLSWDRRVAQPAPPEPDAASAGAVTPQRSSLQAEGPQIPPVRLLAPESLRSASPPETAEPAYPGTKALPLRAGWLGQGAERDGADRDLPVSSQRATQAPPRLARMLPQPGVAVATMLLAIGTVLAGVRYEDISLGLQPFGEILTAVLLAATLVLTYRYPIHIRLHLKVQVSTMVYYLVAALLPLSLGMGVAALGTLLGEVSVRRQRKLYPSDIATAVGRWTVLVFLGTLVAHVPAQGDVALAPLAACAVVLAMGDLLTLPLIIASITGERPLRVLRALATDTAVPDGIQYLLGFLAILASQRAAWVLVLCAVPAVLVYQATKAMHEVQDSTHHLLEGMADTVDLRDSYTGGHSRRVADFCRRILDELDLMGPDAEMIVSAARVHDIGKIAIPDAILMKPGPLTGEERAQMQTHAERGAEVLARHRDFRHGVAVVLHHHEAWDGSGYPRGLKGLAIPFGARLMAVADAFDAMTSDRPYRGAMSAAKAASILRQGRGLQWDPQMVDALLRCIDVQTVLAELAVLPSPDCTTAQRPSSTSAAGA